MAKSNNYTYRAHRLLLDLLAGFGTFEARGLPRWRRKQRIRHSPIAQRSSMQFASCACSAIRKPPAEVLLLCLIIYVFGIVLTQSVAEHMQDSRRGVGGCKSGHASRALISIGPEQSAVSWVGQTCSFVRASWIRVSKRSLWRACSHQAVQRSPARSLIVLMAPSEARRGPRARHR